MNITIIYLTLFFIFINFLLCFYKNKISHFLKIIDIPKKNKIHTRKSFLFGGIIFFVNLIFFFLYDIFFFKNLEATFLFSLKVISIKQQIFFFLTIISIFAIGLYDDVYNLKPHHKTIIFIIFVYFFLLSNPNYPINELIFYTTNKKIYFENFSIYFTIFCFVITLNAFNMFDGINLQSAILYLSFLLIFFLKNINIEFLLVFFISMIFFIYYNTRSFIFLGNSGVFLLAFLTSFIIIVNYNQKKNYFVEEILLYMFLPGIDMIRLFFFRLLKGRNPFQADLNHFHHILLNNFNYKKTIFILFLLISTPVILFNIFYINPIILIILSGTIYFFLTFNFYKYFKNKTLLSKIFKIL